MSVRESGRARERPRNKLDGVLVSPALMCDHAEEMKPVGVIRHLPQYLAVQPFRPVVPPGLMMGKAGLNVPRSFSDPLGFIIVIASSRHAWPKVDLVIEAAPSTSQPFTLARRSPAAADRCFSLTQDEMACVAPPHNVNLAYRRSAPVKLSEFFTPRPVEPAVPAYNEHGDTTFLVPPCRRAR
jgi:hypothetical protein